MLKLIKIYFRGKVGFVQNVNMICNVSWNNKIVQAQHFYFRLFADCVLIFLN